MTTPLRTLGSHAVGWLADRRLPKRLRAPAHRIFAALAKADLEETRPPLDGYASVAAFFVRRLVDGARPIVADPMFLPSPADGRVQSIEPIENDTILQAKGQPYSVSELLAGVEGDCGADGPVELNGGLALTVYLSPRDYHRVHCPEAGELERVRWVDGARFSVAPKVLLARPRVFVRNERAVLRLRSSRGTYFLVLVGALNVGRIRVMGVEPGQEYPTRRDPHFARGEELGRFELGSTVILLFPPGMAQALPQLGPEDPVRMGEALARLSK
ncbi:archaetidylserine decarboxylase [Engelhardtia mirabilis]|uniref:phosphatidylserine decarboxylase n=1 Tax=Engelhardtia mirabilis TaxID=2528011 RepID=A0A518BPJ6_9BACT|nr:Phosphatidylserine decarboxylase proenzyme [Planctomycetes bacterium Pla133]QDV03228.1 Phosphatidylserine decarboxylase proenzyme [Planctomycetes bacterium Pla86]